MNTIWIVMPILIVLMFTLGLELDRSSFLKMAKNPLAVAAGAFGQIILLPALAFSIAYVMKLSPVWFMGVMLISCCPGGSSSNVFSMIAKGDVALSVTLTAISSIITLFTLPVIMKFTAEYVSLNSGLEINLPVGKLLMQNIVLIFVPMGIGVIVRQFAPEISSRIHKVLKNCAFPALMLLALIFFLQYTAEIFNNFTVLGTALSLLLILAVLLGGLMSRLLGFSPAVKRTIVIEIGMQNAAQAIAIASSPLIFNNPEMAIPAIVYALLMNVVLLMYIAKYLGRKADRSK